MGIPVTVQIGNIVPYGNGSRVDLTLGNTSAVTLNQVSAYITCQPKKGGLKILGRIDFGKSLYAGKIISTAVFCEDIEPSNLQNILVADINVKFVQYPL
jgi:hypothetical protein